MRARHLPSRARPASSSNRDRSPCRPEPPCPLGELSLSLFLPSASASRSLAPSGPGARLTPHSASTRGGTDDLPISRIIRDVGARRQSPRVQRTEYISPAPGTRLSMPLSGSSRFFGVLTAHDPHRTPLIPRSPRIGPLGPHPRGHPYVAFQQRTWQPTPQVFPAT